MCGAVHQRFCRHRGHELVIMIDSDCLPGPDFISTHLDMHRESPGVACIGGAVVGRGSSAWARLDGIMSWVHAAPHYPRHTVETPYHLPTTNFSVKLALLPNRPFVFDERLRTGEDCLLIRELRHNGQRQAARCTLSRCWPTTRKRKRSGFGKVLA